MCIPLEMHCLFNVLLLTSIVKNMEVDIVKNLVGTSKNMGQPKCSRVSCLLNWEGDLMPFGGDSEIVAIMLNSVGLLHIPSDEDHDDENILFLGRCSHRLASI